VSSSVEDKRIKVFNRRTRLKWREVFDFILDNEKINQLGSFVLDPKIDLDLVNLNLSNEGVSTFTNYIFCKNLKKSYNINRFIFEDFNFLKLNINGVNFKVASICHIYYEDLLEDMINLNKNLYNTKFDVDFYFTLTEGSSNIGQKEWVIKELKRNFPNCQVYILPNKGLDIGPFFKVLEKIYNIKYDYIFKTHTKKSLQTSGAYFGNIWRKDLLSILTPTKIEKINSLMESGVEMVGSSKWIIPSNKDDLNIEGVPKLLKELHIENHGTRFVGGTMFCVKYSLIKKTFSLKQIKDYYNKMEEGYFFQITKGDKEYLTHSFERVFGMMCKTINGV
tara:strand:- start:24283 stop:25287 length:1005 start_codon:yes stop_codon:yes gene_type:complete